MTALDIDQQLDAAIWALLEANTDITTVYFADVGRRLKAYPTTQSDGEAKKRLQRGPNDYPQLKVDVTGGSIGVNAPRVFAMNSTSYTAATCDAPVPVTHLVTVTVTFDKEDSPSQTPIEAAIRASFFAKWPNLGIAGITGFVMNRTRPRDTSGLPTSRIALTVTRKVYHSALD